MEERGNDTEEVRKRKKARIKNSCDERRGGRNGGKGDVR